VFGCFASDASQRGLQFALQYTPWGWVLRASVRLARNIKASVAALNRQYENDAWSVSNRDTAGCYDDDEEVALRMLAVRMQRWRRLCVWIFVFGLCFRLIVTQ